MNLNEITAKGEFLNRLSDPNYNLAVRFKDIVAADFKTWDNHVDVDLHVSKDHYLIMVIFHKTPNKLARENRGLRVRTLVNYLSSQNQDLKQPFSHITMHRKIDGQKYAIFLGKRNEAQ